MVRVTFEILTLFPTRSTEVYFVLFLGTYVSQESGMDAREASMWASKSSGDGPKYYTHFYTKILGEVLR